MECVSIQLGSLCCNSVITVTNLGFIATFLCFIFILVLEKKCLNYDKFRHSDPCDPLGSFVIFL